MPENLKETSLTRCWVVMKNDKGTRVFYSRDKKSKKARPNMAVGIRRFKKMLYEGALKGDWKLAIIYENKPQGKQVDRLDPKDA